MIEIWTEELTPSWWWSPYNYLGGTPEAVVNLAESFDDDVCVYYDGSPCEKNGVYYLDRGAYTGKDILIAFNSVPKRLAKYNIYTTSWYHARQEDYEEFDERIVLSPYHQSIFGENSRIIPLSCTKEQFENPSKIYKQCLFSSSPDRGRDFLESIWDDVERETNAQLITTYSEYISEDEMIELYKSSEFWLHPGDGIELFCISALKAQAAECIPVYVPNMALETTVRYGVRTTKEEFKETLIDTIKFPPLPEEITFPSWKEVAGQYLINLGVTHGT